MAKVVYRESKSVHKALMGISPCITIDGIPYWATDVPETVMKTLHADDMFRILRIAIAMEKAEAESGRSTGFNRKEAPHG